jgi:hypothetical protein
MTELWHHEDRNGGDGQQMGRHAPKRKTQAAGPSPRAANHNDTRFELAGRLEDDIGDMANVRLYDLATSVYPRCPQAGGHLIHDLLAVCTAVIPHHPA